MPPWPPVSATSSICPSSARHPTATLTLARDHWATEQHIIESGLSFTFVWAYRSRLAWDAPQWQYDAWVSTYTAIAAGELAVTSGGVERITGRRAESLRDFLAAS